MTIHSEKNRPRSVVELILRAARSTVIISLVAVSAALLREGRFQLSVAKTMMIQNWELGLIVFCGVLIWDSWFERTKPSHLVEDREPDR